MKVEFYAKLETVWGLVRKFPPSRRQDRFPGGKFDHFSNTAIGCRNVPQTRKGASEGIDRPGRSETPKIVLTAWNWLQKLIKFEVSRTILFPGGGEIYVV